VNYSKLKILFVTSSLTSGGAEKVMSILASECAEMGAEVSLVIMTDKKRTYSISEKVTCYTIDSNNKCLKNIGRIGGFRKAIKKSNADVVVPFLPTISMYTMIANIGIGRKMVMSERADPKTKIFDRTKSLQNLTGNFFMRKLRFFNFANYMIFQTPDAQAFYGKKLQRKSTIIPNPLDTSALPERFKGEREKRIVAAGRFSEEKNFPMLIRAFARFKKKFPEYALELYGEGGLRGEFEELCRGLDITDSVSMPGFVNDLADRMVNASMYVSTSNHEGISNSMLEALGMGVPTIVTDCPVGGAKMFVKTDENGILIDMEDEDALLNAMTKIASDSEYSEKLSENSVKIREELSARKIAEKWIEVFEKVCSK